MHTNILPKIPSIAKTEPELESPQKLPKIKNGKIGITNLARTMFIMSENSLIML